MKKYLLLLMPLLTAALFFNSCKQCNSTVADNQKTDTVSIPLLEEMNQQISADSLNPFLYYKRAQIYEANEDYKSAATDMFLALTLDSVRPEFYLYCAELFKKTGDVQRGVAFMNKAISIDSLNTAFYVKAAELIYIDKNIPDNYKAAMNYLNAAIEKDPQNADIYFYKGTIYKEVGDTMKALSNFQTATELNPQFYNAYVQIGMLLRNRKDKNAEKYFDNAIRVSNSPEDALYAKANLLKEDGIKLYDSGKDSDGAAKLNSAIEQFKKVVEVNHKNTEAYMGIGFCYYQLDSVLEAYRYYGMAIKMEPAYAGAYFSQGLCAEELGRKKEAIQLYQNCLNIDPTFKRAQEHLSKLGGS